MLNNIMSGLKCSIGADGVLHASSESAFEGQHHVKELIRGIKKSLPIMKLTAIDQDVSDHLLYCILSPPAPVRPITSTSMQDMPVQQVNHDD